MSSVPYVVFDTSTGEILRKGVCSDSVLAMQVAGAEQAVAMLAPGTVVDDRTQIVDTQTMQLVEKP